MFDPEIITTGFIIFFARICDVSIGTVRVITTIQGRTAIAFCLAFFEIIIWLTVASTVINQISEKPLLVIFYAFGFATGNVVGILVERRLAFGTKILRIITPDKGHAIAVHLRNKGQPVTIYEGEGMHGTVYELYIACQRRDLKWILPEVRRIDPKLFYVIEQARDMSKIYQSAYSPLKGLQETDKAK
ncbi:DUF2179 domain-containing protein [Pseudodesulfovibrio portus]|uniref:UPF0316 protein n=1 Tax=Pseudodesulfovibrio portus TaxID=231439 RepID=A0ABN6RUG3_9BACT|nr:DUF5698 domain-containing protein [Pseudodesulfovibrio portus]BDQ34737.1 UPF0316 protein [Pseudodesulfovibrio portus]